MDWMKRTKPTAGLIICLFLTMLLFSCTGASNAQMDTKSPFMISLNIIEVSKSSPFSAELAFIIKNKSADAYQVLKWGTPFEQAFNDNMFSVTHDGKDVAYLGRQFKRGAPQVGDFIELSPHGEIATRFFLQKGYDLTQPGLYSVVYSKPYLNVKKDNGEMMLVPVQSNRVDFQLGS